MPISICNRLATPRLCLPVLQALLRRICIAMGSGIEVPELSVVLTSDAHIAALNRRWRQVVGPTDVLSFPQMEFAAGGVVAEEPFVGPVSVGATPRGPAVWGDVVVSYDTAARQARRYGHNLEVEVAILLVHGILHLLGHDHDAGRAQAQRMRDEEGRVLRLIYRNAWPPPGRH